jgi:hypothetical protein
MLSAFDDATGQFREAYLSLVNYSGSDKAVGFRVRAQAGETAVDVLSFCSIFKEIHVRAIKDLTEEARMLDIHYPIAEVKRHFEQMEPLFEQLKKLQTGAHQSPGDLAKLQELHSLLPQLPLPPWMSTEEEAKKHFERMTSSSLQVVYKALFYFIRAYQDPLYKFILELEGQRAGIKSSMNDIQRDKEFKPNNLVADILRDSYAEYLSWFLKWRDMRNKIKYGNGFSTVGPQSNPGIAFNDIDDTQRGIESGITVVRISDVTEALAACSRLTAIALGRAMKHRGEA